MKKEIELIKRKPTFEYILNDLAFESLKFKVIHGVASNQDKFDFDYQLKLKDKEIERLNNIINELEKYIDENYYYDDVGMKIFDVSLLEDKLKELKEK